MVKQEKETVMGNLEFDVIMDGKYEKRVSRGVLLEDDIVGCSMYMSGNEVTVFNALIACEKYIEEQGLKEKFEAYHYIVTSDCEDEEIFKKSLDVLLED